MSETAWAEDVAEAEAAAVPEEKPKPSLRGNRRESSKGWKSGFCGVSNHSYCVGSVQNGSAVGGDTVLCVCDCHTH